jgi:hypothetical protein
VRECYNSRRVRLGRGGILHLQRPYAKHPWHHYPPPNGTNLVLKPCHLEEAEAGGPHAMLVKTSFRRTKIVLIYFLIQYRHFFFQRYIIFIDTALSSRLSTQVHSRMWHHYITSSFPSPCLCYGPVISFGAKPW